MKHLHTAFISRSRATPTIVATMASIVRRASVACPFVEAVPLFQTYAKGRSVLLLGLVPMPGRDRKLGATARANLWIDSDARCRVDWQRSEFMSPVAVAFSGTIWLEADDDDTERTWLVLDGEYAGDSLGPAVGRRLNGAIGRDLLARITDYMEARRAEGLAATG